MIYTEEQNEIIKKYKTLEDIPKEERRYKCPNCLHIVDSTPCPCCGSENLEIMCPLDHAHCSHSVVEKIEFCPLCGRAICPECGCHDVAQVSRITGYLSDVAGWNDGKRQELKDRARYDVA